MKRITKFLNGKKTVIGGVLSLTSGFLQAKEIIQPEDAIFFLGMAGLIFGIGVTHKVAKYKNPTIR